jgi:hypothetical protein
MKKHGIQQVMPAKKEQMDMMMKWWISALIVFMVAIGLGVVAGWWVFKNFDMNLPVRNQPATVTLPEPMQVRAKVLNDLDVMVKGQLSTEIPIDQSIQVPINETLHTVISFDHDVPIKMQVPVSYTLPLDQVIHVDSKVKVTVLGKDISLPIRGDIPIKAQIPINMNVPIDQRVRLKFVAPADAKLQQQLNIPLKTTIATTFPLQGVMQVPVKSELQAQVVVPQPISAVISESDFSFPLSQLALQRVEKNADKSIDDKSTDKTE